ncbi:MAG: DegV family protein [Coriobacteriia bacterium]|nr:DegV family protein [Coriobacteriia bacterium]
MTKIVVDSGCDLPLDFRERFPEIELEIVPLTLTVDGIDYIDDKNLDLAAYLDHTEMSPNGPTTAAPAPQRFLDAYQHNGSVFAITLSSKVSASFESAFLAAKIRADQVKGSLIHVFDSLSSSVGEAQIAIKIAELARAGLPDIEIIKNVEKFISDMSTFFILDSFDTAVKTGRMSRTVATMAEFLKIKPLCEGVDGEMLVVNKTRSYEKAVQQMIKLLKLRIDDFSDRVLAIAHVFAYEKALETQALMMAAIPFRDSYITPTGGICSTYGMRGGVVFAI